MIKRIIFDIDNTLILWKDEWYSEIENELHNLNIEYSKEDVEEEKRIQNPTKKPGFVYNIEIQKDINENGPEEFSDLELISIEELREIICRKRGYILKGGIIDIERYSKAVIDEFRKGRLGKICLE